MIPVLGSSIELFLFPSVNYGFIFGHDLFPRRWLWFATSLFSSSPHLSAFI
jgi:hypothetical protein